jgi:hypothetical protein
VSAASKSEPLDGGSEEPGSLTDECTEVEEEEESWNWGLWHTASVEVRHEITGPAVELELEQNKRRYSKRAEERR